MQIYSFFFAAILQIITIFSSLPKYLSKSICLPSSAFLFCSHQRSCIFRPKSDGVLICKRYNFCYNKSIHSSPLSNSFCAWKYPNVLTLKDEMMTQKYEKYAAIAIEAIFESCKIAARIRTGLSDRQTMWKADASPVTIADLAVQTIVASALCNSDVESNFILAEEDIENTPRGFLERVATKLNVLSNTSKKWDVDQIKSVYKKTQLTEKNLTNFSFQEKSYWVLDPIDGTKGFLQENGQYAVALAYMEAGVPVIGILGCPNLSLNLDAFTEGQGCIAFAIRNRGSKILYFDFLSDTTRTNAFSYNIFNTAELLHTSKPLSRSLIKVVESSDALHSNRNFSTKLMAKLNISEKPLQIASQAKYVTVAQGVRHLQLRFPHKNYKECVWDHCAGALIVEEAGGCVAHANGDPLNYYYRSRFDNSSGIVVASCKSVLENALRGIADCLAEQQ